MLRLLPAVSLATLVGCATAERIQDPIVDSGTSDTSIADGAVDVTSVDTGSDAPKTDAAEASTPTACTCSEPGCGTCPTTAMVAAGGYGIDSTEVTNEAYLAWLDTQPDPKLQPPQCAWNTSYAPAQAWPPDSSKLDFPVADVDQCDAAGYCRWAKKRLCGAIGGGPVLFTDFADATKSQWHNACSGGGSRVYPYGSSYQATACNGADKATGAPIATASSAGCEGGYPSLFDMSGNVWEWENACDGALGENDLCRIRGGSFSQSSTALACDSDSSLPRNSTGKSVGFRCCE